MATASQRLWSLLADGAALFSGLASQYAGPAPGSPEGFQGASGVARNVTIPGVVPITPPTTRAINEETARALLTPEAYMGQVSRDAGPTMTRFSSYPATDLNPEKIAGAQQEAVAGWPLRWSEMIEQVLSRDAHLSGIAQQRVDDVVKGTWRLVRASPDDLGYCLASFGEECLRGVDSLEDALAWLLWGNAYGYNAVEIVWKKDRVSFVGPRGQRIGPIDVMVPARLVPVHPKHFRFDLRTDEPLLWLGSSTQSLPFGKFVFYAGEGQHPIIERRGYMWPCVWLSMFKSMSWAGWAAFVDRFGMPTPLIEYEGTMAQYAEYKAAFNDVLNSLGTGKGAIFPKNAVGIRGLEFPQGGRASDPHSALSDACDSAESIRVLGATLTAKIGNSGSFAASETHVEVKYAKEEADARRVWASMRRDLLTAIIGFNARVLSRALEDAGVRAPIDAMPRRVPKGLQRVPREVDPGARMQLLDSAVNRLGMMIEAEPVYDEFNFVKGTPETCLPGEATPVPSDGKLVGAVEGANEGASAPKTAESLKAGQGDAEGAAKLAEGAEGSQAPAAPKP